jgi:hypothetical protein
MEGFPMLLLVVSAGVLLADLARPVSPEEYHRVVGQQVLSHAPLPPSTRAYYLAKGRVLAGFLRPGMSAEEVRGIVGVRADGWVQEEERWTDTYSLLGLTVRYRVTENGEEGPAERVVEAVEATPP